MKVFGIVFSQKGIIGNTIVQATNEVEAIAKFEAEKVGATILIISTRATA
jgi:hypothetical protein